MATISVELEKVNDADLTLFLVEEPEAHLHPQLQAAVLSFLDEQAEKSRKPREGHQGPAGELQVIVATHSPNLSAWVESKKLVFFRSFLPAQVKAAPADAQDEPQPLAGVPAEIMPDIEPNPVPVGRPRRVTRCIPLAALALDPVARRKVDRYLDVTKSAFLFGGRVLGRRHRRGASASGHGQEDRPEGRCRSASPVPLGCVRADRRRRFRAIGQAAFVALQ